MRNAEAIVVLGCRSRSRLQRRVERGAKLFQKRVAPVLVLSGGGRGPEPEALFMRRTALALGIPEAVLLVEPRSHDTLENARETACLLRACGWRRVVLVSDRTHLPRAALLFRLAGLRVVGCAGVGSTSMRREIRAALREAAVLPGSLLRALAAARQSRYPPVKSCR